MKIFSRQTRRPASPKLRTIKLCLERLEERQVLSGFGPEDGAYIVEPRLSAGYGDVKIPPTDQAIMAAVIAGTMTPAAPSPNFAVARYDSLGNVDTTYGDGGLATPSLGPYQGASSLVIQPDGKAVVAGSYRVSDKNI